MAKPDVTVNPASQITASQWVTMIRQNPYVPQEIKQNIEVGNNAIVGPATIKKPAGTISDWRNDFAAAFRFRHWEVTTAQENFTLIKEGAEFRVLREIVFDLQKGEVEPGLWLTTGPNQRQWMPDTRGVVQKFKLGAIGLLFGETYSSEQ